MLNLRWGIVSGLTAFVLAFLISLLIGRAIPIVALLRGLSFAGLFFLLGIGSWALINHFIPEILTPDSGSDPTASIFSGEHRPGSQINITLGESSEAALPGKDGRSHDLDEVGDINDLVSGNFKRQSRHIDQRSTNSYNEESGEFTPVQEDLSTEQGEEGGFSVNFGNLISGGESEAEELQPLTDSFSSSFDGLSSDDSALSGLDEPSVPERKTARNRPEKFEGDFDAKEIAAGLRTVLQKDK